MTDIDTDTDDIDQELADEAFAMLTQAHKHGMLLPTLADLVRRARIEAREEGFEDGITTAVSIVSLSEIQTHRHEDEDENAREKK